MELYHNNITKPINYITIISQRYSKKYITNKQKYTNTKHPKPQNQSLQSGMIPSLTMQAIKYSFTLLNS